METFSALLTICAGNSPVTGEFATQRPVMRSFDVFFDLCLNERLNKQSWGWRFETSSCPLWCHSNDFILLHLKSLLLAIGLEWHALRNVAIMNDTGLLVDFCLLIGPCESMAPICIRCSIKTHCHSHETFLQCDTVPQIYRTYGISQEICTRFCCALLCCGYAIVHNEFTWSIYPYSSGLLCWHWGNR